MTFPDLGFQSFWQKRIRQTHYPYIDVHNREIKRRYSSVATSWGQVGVSCRGILLHQTMWKSQTDARRCGERIWGQKRWICFIEVSFSVCDVICEWDVKSTQNCLLYMTENDLNDERFYRTRKWYLPLLFSRDAGVICYCYKVSFSMVS